MADIAASVLAKLKNKAKSSGISYQQCLQDRGRSCVLVWFCTERSFEYAF